MREFLRLLLLVVIILPLMALFIGPGLVLSALRGVQRLGPIVLNPGRQGTLGRIGALGLGLLICLVVWGGVILLLSQVGLVELGRGLALDWQARATAAAPVAVSSATPVPPPSVAPQTPATPTPTPTHTEEIPVPSPSPTPSPIRATPTPPLPTATFTPAPPTGTAILTATLALSPTATPTLSPTQLRDAISAVETANELLRNASMEPSIGNLAALEALWQARALAKAQAFAQDLYQSYQRPLKITFVYLAQPVVLEGESEDTAFVISTEEWTYAGLYTLHTESFEFTYTLSRRPEGWVITDYIYRNVPGTPPSGTVSISTTLPLSTAIVATTAITPTGQ